MSTYGERLTKAREYRGLSQKQLADAAGITKSAINQVESGLTKGLRHDNHLRACKALQIRPEWLSMEQEPMLIYEIEEQRGVYHASNVSPGPSIRGQVPLISWVQAGEWAEIVDNFAPGEADEWRDTTASVGPHAFALRVEGDSMTAPSGLSIPEGSVVIVDPDTEYRNGSIVVAKLVDTQEATLKKLVIDGPNRYLKPLNPEYRQIPINGNCRIIGVAKKVEFDL